jgi:DNA-binding response OmpR family regulator
MARVLLVEDDVAFRGLVTRIFTEWGHDVVEAGSVEEALACAVARRPETVVADIGLPDGNGFDLTVQLLALPCPMRVIVVSSDRGAGNGQAAQRVGAIRFFPKDEMFDGALRRLLG